MKNGEGFSAIIHTQIQDPFDLIKHTIMVLCMILQDQDIYNIYDNEEFEGQDTTSPSSKDTLIYREVN